MSIFRTFTTPTTPTTTTIITTTTSTIGNAVSVATEDDTEGVDKMSFNKNMFKIIVMIVDVKREHHVSFTTQIMIINVKTEED